MLPSATQSVEEMSAMYVSANHRHVETLHPLIFQLDVSLGSIINAVFGLLRFRHKNHLVMVGKAHVLAVTNTGGNVLFKKHLKPQTQLEMSPS